MADDTPSLPTRVAQAVWGDNRFRGYSVNTELAGRIDAWSAVSLAVGHRILSPDEAAVLDDVVVCALAADPRIWPLKIVRLLSAYGHTTTGTVAGMYCTEAADIGWRAYFIAGEFLESLASLPDATAWGQDIESRIDRRERFPGYGVAHRHQDERVTALAACLDAKGRTSGRHWSLARELDVLLAPRGVRMNMGAAGAAALMDLGFTPTQLLALGPYLVAPNYLANAVEGAEQRPATLRRLPAESIDDRTPKARLSPRATARDDSAG